MSDSEVIKMEKECVYEFASKLQNVDNELFSFSRPPFFPNASRIINTLFLECNLGESTLINIYNQVLKKNPFFKSFDYSYITSKFLTKIKGLYRECSNSFL